MFHTMIYLKRLASPLVLAIATMVAAPAMASDHLDAPSLSGNGQIDVNDLYAFQNPNNPLNSVLILTVNPGANDSGNGLSPTDFGNVADGISYQIEIDNNGDANPDITYQANFAGAGSSQTVSLTRNGVAQAAGATGTTLTTMGATGNGRVSTGVFDDPFFFDLNGFNNGFQFTGDDFFEGLDVSAIVLEVPNTELNGASSNISVAARTLLNGNQVDRVGRPAINTALISGSRKEDFNVANEVDDFNDFGAEVQAAIEGLNGGDTATAAGQAGFLLPDVLTFDTSDAATFLNGRGLADDVIDAELQLLTGTDISDGVDVNAEGFLNAFPFLAQRNTAAAIPEPSTLLPIALAIGALAGRRRRS
ncbi:DUF4331 family protein [bacterium]|nr:DUF4331 family protein [bacterium]